MSFFVGWPQWAQMSIILAFLLAIVVTVGYSKSRYSIYQLKRKRRSLEEARASGDPMEQLARIGDLERQIPFGIRALESGVEVEGVYISRSNTPAVTPIHGSPSSSAPESLNGDHGPPNAYPRLSSSDIPFLDLPQPKHGPFTQPQAPSRPPHSASRYTRENSSSLLNSGSMISTGSNSQGPTTLIYSSQPLLKSSGSDSSADTPELRSKNSHDSFSGHDSSSTDYATRKSSSSGSDKTPPKDGQSFRTQSSIDETANVPDVKQRERKAADLGLMTTHRLSHAAETGQLTPRVRRPGVSGEWSGSGNGQHPGLTGDYFAGNQPNTSSSGQQGYTFSTSPGYAEGYGARHSFAKRTSDPHVQSAPLLNSGYPGQVGDQSHVINSHPTSMSLSHAPVRSESEPVLNEPASRPNTQAREQQFGAFSDHGTSPHPPSFTRGPIDDPQVRRTVNSGFQILQPGTLPAQEAPREPNKLHKKERSRDSSEGLMHRTQNTMRRWSKGSDRRLSNEPNRPSFEERRSYDARARDSSAEADADQDRRMSRDAPRDANRSSLVPFGNIAGHTTSGARR
ncbi:hypothetical protein K402DRAFT_183216 [Aulographum hederae CBS 113979]|uniref:Uncharacterized protein n=1 Tax=Aulographum hederae CBS 113979 TaxID=1176131 RepID=A0A6G1GQ03_9PEZI|nr:hypothetical protein K402DRAFT_183216 [Aulographum hederae CBS 113979]